uniref:Rhodanese-like domain-containing protein n=1 Tax=Thermorudis sp. TaxID=1969470 RepID=A0A7C2WID6_9BACT
MVFRRLLGGRSVPEVTPEEALRRQQAGALIVDVREPEEWRAGHIPGAVHVPLGELGSRLHELDAERELILVCRSGNRSARATVLLQQAGFRQVYNLSGGLIAWTRQRLPLV